MLAAWWLKSIHSANWNKTAKLKENIKRSSRYTSKGKVISYNGLFLMRQFEVLKEERVQLKEQKNNFFTGFFCLSPRVV